MLVYTWSINFNKSADNMVMFVHDLFLLGSWKLALYPNVYKNVHEFGNRYCKGVS